jgi:xanthine/CO dehydrogenase XdhC/CoxF family maturation factor
MKELSAILAALTTGPAEPAALATLLTVAGSSYRRPGARLLLTAGGRRLGSISGGCLEEDLLARARRVLETGRAETVVYDTTSENDLVWGVGLGCHGVVKLLVEKLPPRPAWAAWVAAEFAVRRPVELLVVHGGENAHDFGTRLARDPAANSVAVDRAHLYREIVRPPPALAIFGAGDDAQPLARLAHELGWRVTVADPRAAFATAERFPTAATLVVAPAEHLAERAGLDDTTLAVVMTHHYVHDVPLLRALLPRPLAFLGLLGPRKRAEKILADLAAEGAAITAEQRARLHAPVGLDLGADAPEQVALAILAEMQAVLAGREPRPLRERNRPIHG